MPLIVTEPPARTLPVRGVINPATPCTGDTCGSSRTVPDTSRVACAPSQIDLFGLVLNEKRPLSAIEPPGERMVPKSVN
jgi:hypothetical protein